MIGSAIGAAIVMVLGAGNPAPWGGWIVAPVAQKSLRLYSRNSDWFCHYSRNRYCFEEANC